MIGKNKHWPSAHRSGDITHLVRTLRPAFATHEPGIVGAALGELAAFFIAGHHPSMRDTARKMLFDYIDELVPVVLEEMIEEGAAPPNWIQ
jgi:hypothetical protein